MAYGLSKLQKCQIGLETTPGTAIVATNVWRGMFKMSDKSVQQTAEERVGTFFPTERNFNASKGGEVQWGPSEATFEQFPYVLEAGVKTVTTGVADTGGSGKVYTYTFPTTQANTTSTYTLEVGSNVRVDEMEYAYVSKFTLAGAAKEALKVTATWVGRQCTDAEFTTSLSLPTVEEVIFSKGKLYIDDTAASIGVTAKTATWLGLQMDVETGINQLWTADGISNVFGTTKNVGPKITGKLTLEHDATGVAEFGYARATTVRYVKFLWEGTALTTAGSVYSKKSLIFTAGIVYDAVPDVGDQSGDEVIELAFHVCESTPVPTFVVVNQLTALT